MGTQAKRRFILTGPPGIGKTTIIRDLCSLLKQMNIPVVGFYTEELRKNRQRIGFDVININGGRGPLARIEDTEKSRFKVGKYTVTINEFESIVLPILQKINPSQNKIIVIDEIGKMEMFSQNFKFEIKKIFDNEKNIILATIPIAKGKPIPLVESIRNDPKNEIINVNRFDTLNILLQLINSIRTLRNEQGTA